MTWLVEATHGAGTWSREFDTVEGARGWEFLMACHGYDTTRPMPVDGGRHLKVINGGRGEGVSSAAPAAKGL